MSKDKKNTRYLSDDDADLWERVAGTTKPLRKAANRHVDAPAPRPGIEESPRPKKPAEDMLRGEPPLTTEKTKKANEPPPPGGYHRGEARALASGKLAIEARLDLHGMRQREAHAALKGFIERCRVRGQRHVLVITGKGAGASPGERGVLNREVPRWLGEPEFRESVVGYTQAHKRHGGDGALYVRLRRVRQKG